MKTPSLSSDSPSDSPAGTGPAPEVQSAQAFPSSFGIRWAFFGGLAALLAALVLFAVIEGFERKREAEENAATAMRAANMAVNGLHAETGARAELAARLLAGADKAKAVAMLASFQDVWPYAVFTAYDNKGNALRAAAETPEELGAHTVRGLVVKALIGQRVSGFTQRRGFPGISVAVPVKGAAVAVVVCSFPFDQSGLGIIKERVGIDAALFPYLDVDGLELAPTEVSPSTLDSIQAARPLKNALWAAVKPLSAKSLAEPRSIYISGERAPFSAQALTAQDGTPVALLCVRHSDSLAFVGGADAKTQKTSLPLGLALWQLVCAGAAGCITAVAVAVANLRRGKQMAEAFAGALNVFTANEKSGRSTQGMWSALPAPLDGAFARVSMLLRNYRNEARAEARRSRAGDECGSEEGADASALGREDFLRIFAASPVGLFQCDAEGRFVRVNHAFAALLGYDSPARLMAEQPAFSAFFLYAGAVLNPVADIAALGPEGHVVSLRRQDGRVRNFLLCVTELTSPTGEPSGIMEGSLRDRELEEKNVKAVVERDAAKRQSASLALLLASTCAQIRSYLHPALDGGPERRQRYGRRAGDGTEEVAPVTAAPAAASPVAVSSVAATIPTVAEAAIAPEHTSVDAADDDDCRSERRRGVQAVNSVLGDIYQVAMTEAERSRPGIVPIDFRRFFQGLCRQALPSLCTRGISLRCEMEKGLPLRVSGPAPQLRHALERALLAVTGPVKSGWAGVSLRRDPNAPHSPGVERVICTVFWTRATSVASILDVTGGEAYTGAAFSSAADGGAYEALFEFSSDPDAPMLPVLDTPADGGVLDISQEREVITFLAERMRGEFLGAEFLRDVRTMSVIVPLYAFTEEVAEFAAETPSALQAGAAGAAQASTQEGEVPGRETGAQEENVFRSSRVFANPEDETLTEMDMAALAGDSHPVFDPLTVETIGDDANAEKESGASLRILLIDSSRSNRMLFSMHLRDTPHRITEAHDGPEGVQAYTAGEFDVVFLDMEMPLMDGYQVSRLIRALEEDTGRERTPIVAMTSYDLPEMRQRCLISGCTEFISKPFSKMALVNLLEAFEQLGQE